MAEQKKPELVCAGEAGATQDTQLLVNARTERDQKKYPSCSLPNIPPFACYWPNLLD